MAQVSRVGCLDGRFTAAWRSADLPAPTMQANAAAAHSDRASGDYFGAGWIETKADDVYAVTDVGMLGPNHIEGWQSPAVPSPTLLAQAHGGGHGPGWIKTGEDSEPVADTATSKPLYRVPSMAEIAAIKPNGFTAASTFSGCGGSSLGYRMAGFRVAWASEFVQAARDVYCANAPGTQVDSRDIREVQPAEILAALSMAAGELDLLDGSPPCASFSTAGKRSADWGKVKHYSDTEQRTDDLFYEFSRILAGLQPRTFIAENVSGLVKGSAKGYFKAIMRALKQAGYRVEARLLDSQWLGVPQARQRIIFAGVRSDLGLRPAFPEPLPYRYSVRDALPWVISQGDNGGFGEGGMRATDSPSPTIGAGPSTGNGAYPPSRVVALTGAVDPETGAPLTSPARPATKLHTETRKFTIAELRRICAFPDDFILSGTYAQRWERLGRAVPPVMMSHVAATVRDEILRKL
jgi:DNA (cytosine-5)-methyltransferase 1